MKRNSHYLLLILLFCTLNGLAQSPDMPYAYRPDSVALRLDSMFYGLSGFAQGIAAPRERTIYTYNSEGLRVQSLSYARDTVLNQWKQDYKRVYSYNASGRITEILSFDWRENLNDWLAVHKISQSYHANGRVASYTLHELSLPSNELKPKTKTDYSFDPAGNTTEIMSYFWDTATESFRPVSRQTFTYLSQYYLTEHLQYYRDTTLNTWVSNARSTYSYNALGYEEEKIDYTKTTAGLWKPHFRFGSAYDSLGRLQESLFQVRDSADTYWINIDRSTYTNSDTLTETISYDWVSSSGTWVHTGRVLEFYNEDFNLDGRQFFSWNGTTSGWELSGKDVFVYSPAGNLLMKTDFRRDPVSGIIQATERYTYFWSDGTSSADGLSPMGALRLYPNPAATSVHLTFELSQPDRLLMYVTDLQGRRIHVYEEEHLYATGSQHVFLDLPEGLAEGMYILNIRGAYHLASLRFAVKRS